MINKKYLWILLPFAIVVSSGITYVLTKKDQPKFVNRTKVYKDSIVSLKNEILEYEKMMQLANDYILGKSLTDLEYFEQHSDSLIVELAENIKLHQNREVPDNVKVVSRVVVDTLVQIEKDLTAEEELFKVKSELELVKKEIEKPQKTKEILNIVSSKGKKIQYIGEVQNGKANGYGEGIFETGSVYKGSWKDNLRHGKGIFTWEDNEHYEGNFVEGKREGYGEYQWKNGEVYKGQWKNDMRHGEGAVFKKNGKIKQQGVWENDGLK